MAESIRITTPFTEEMSRKLKAGDSVLITGTIISARDAAHKAMTEALAKGEPLPVERLARKAQMSTRSFIRTFRESTGTAPAAWVRAQRVREAQRLLESTDLAIEQVASTCGFGSAITMRQAFARILSTTPSAYRRRFCTVSPDPAEM